MDAWRGEITAVLQTGKARSGLLLRRLQRGETIGMHHSRSMHSVGKRCHELRIPDEGVSWRVMYRIDSDVIIVAEVFSKKTGKTPKRIIDICKARLRDYDNG